jgi:Trk K+ transport system NAD-binding subunit
MVQFFKVELFSFILGFREFIYSLAERVDYRMKSFKFHLRGNLIEKDLDQACIRLGKTALEKFSLDKSFSRFHFEMFLQELREIQTLRDQYALSLQALSDLQRKALKDSLSNCSEQFQRSGWELAQIEAPANLSFGKIKIKEIPLKNDFLVLMIEKDNQLALVNGETVLQAGDTLICIGTGESLQKFRSFLR